MKTSLILISSIVLAPLAVVAGASAAAILGFSTLVGVSALAFNDYARPIGDSSKFSTVSVAKPAESLPLAA
tara:strand:+ start:152 stop:364 length:213 start_codon:yes stop_codon:yes gene_type:complete